MENSLPISLALNNFPSAIALSTKTGFNKFLSKGRPATDSEEDISIEVKSVSFGNWQLKETGSMPNSEIFETISTI